jgi:hypothetical protein
MTKAELIKHWEDELTFTRIRIDENLKNKELCTALKYQMHEKSIIEFLESLKQLSEETLSEETCKDKVKEKCEHPYNSVLFDNRRGKNYCHKCKCYL